MSASVLIVEDDAFLVNSLRKLLEGNGYAVRSAGDVGGAVREVGTRAPDLMLLDINLPDGDGIALCRRLRTQWRFPILMLTSRGDAMDKVVGLEVGADDYLTKPFEAAELLARIRALLRRTTEYQAEAKQDKCVEVGPLKVDFSAHAARVGEKTLELTEKEFQLLGCLAENSGRAISRERLFELVWGFDIDFSTNTLEVFVYRLRSKLEKAGAKGLIQTMRGYGYKLEAP